MTVYAPGSQVLSADLNAWQTRMYGTRTKQIHALAGAPADLGDDWDPNGANYAQGSSASGWVVPIPMEAGDRILEVRCYIQDNLGVAITATLRAITHVGAGSTIGSAATSAAGGTDQTLTIGPVTESVDGTETYIVRFTPAGGAQCRVYAIEVDYDHPA